MNTHDASVLASRILGIYALIQSISYLPALGTQIGFSAGVRPGANLDFAYAFTILYFVLAFGLGLFLLLAAERVAVLLFKSDSDETEGDAVRKEDVQLIGFSVIGVFILVQVLPRMIRLILLLVMAGDATRYRPVDLQQTLLDLGVDLVQFGLGVWLLLGGKGLVGAIRRLRERGE